MIDQWGRTIDYLRISLTDRCNLRCRYCMPENGICQISHDEILRYDEILRLCRVMAGMGLKKIKLTGGEPLVRKNCAELVRELKQIPGITQVTLTTNGVLLKEQMQALADAGLDSLNISLDTLDRASFLQITRRDLLDEVLEGLNEAMKYPDIPLKINCVPIDTQPEHVIALAKLAQTAPIHVRFIEMMPIGEGCRYVRSQDTLLQKTVQGHGQELQSLNEAEILEILENAFGPAIPCEEQLGNGPGHYVSLEGFAGKIGFISAISHKFCAQCNRLRLTSEGYLKACLQYQTGIDIKGPMRSGCSDEAMQEFIMQVLAKKPAGHQFLEEKTELPEERVMAQIGG